MAGDGAHLHLASDGQGLQLGDVLAADELPDEHAVAPDVRLDACPLVPHHLFARTRSTVTWPPGRVWPSGAGGGAWTGRRWVAGTGRVGSCSAGSLWRGKESRESANVLGVWVLGQGGLQAGCTHAAHVLIPPPLPTPPCPPPQLAPAATFPPAIHMPRERLLQ